MTPTEALKHEHEVILMVLDAAQREVRAMGTAGRADGGRVGKLVEFFRNFVDRCHHAKEERQLFARMQQRGVAAEGGPISVMLLEHDDGRRRVASIAEAIPAAARGETSAVAAVRQNLLAYVELLRRHIEKENNVLYPIADRILTAEDQQELAEGFERIEAQEIGEGVHEKYHRLAHELSHI